MYRDRLFKLVICIDSFIMGWNCYSCDVLIIKGKSYGVLDWMVNKLYVRFIYEFKNWCFL